MFKQFTQFITGRKKRGLPPRIATSGPRHQYINPLFEREREHIETQQQQDHGDSWIYISILIILSGLIVFVLNYIPSIKIKNVEVTGTHYISQNQVEESIHAVLDKRFLFFIQRDAYWLVNQHTVADAITKDASDSFALKNITVTKKFPSSISVVIEERVPGLTWITDNQYYYIDPTGVVTQVTHADQLDPAFPKIFDRNNIPTHVNESAISENIANLVLELRERVPSDTSLTIDSFFIPEITCKKHEVVSKEVQLNSNEQEEIERIDEQKRLIQEKLQNGDITIDESLALLKNLEKSRELTDENNIPLHSTQETGTNANTNSFDSLESKIVFEDVYSPTECRLTEVAHDVFIKTAGGWDIYFTDELSLDIQMKKLDVILKEKYPEEPRYLSYIDLRYENKVYYQ